MLVGNPSLVKVVQVLAHVLNDVLHCDVHSVLNYALVQVANDALDYAELLEKFAASIKDFVREDVLLAIDPKIREALLGRVENLGEVAETALLVEDFVGLRELFTVGASGTVGFKNFTQPFNLVEEALACSLSIFRVEVVFFIGTLL